MAQCIDNPNTAFPWDRVEAAKRYLYAVKPWWARFGERFVIVPTYIPSQRGNQFGSITSTDQSFRLYIDRTFAASAQFHFLSGAIEHEFQHHTRDTWRRLRWLDPDDWREFANIALDLEINSGIDAEQRSLDINKIYLGLKNSLVFTQREFTNWSITAPPGLDDEGWIPRLIPLPEGLSAEEYLRLLQKSQEMYDNKEALSEKSTSKPESEEDSPAPGIEENLDVDIRDQPKKPKLNEKGKKENNQLESGDDETGDPGSEDKPDIGTNKEQIELSNDINGKNKEEPEIGDAETTQKEGPAEGVGFEWRESNDSGMTDSESARQSGTNVDNAVKIDGVGEPSAKIAQQVETMRSKGINQIWASEIENKDDPFSDSPWKPDEEDNAKPLTPAEIADAYAQLESDITKTIRDGDIGFALRGDAQIVKWAAEYRRSRGINWDSRFAKLLSSAYTSAKIKGQSDLSYSVRNPNQQPLGVILQGMHSYTPNIYVLQDVSASMLNDEAMAKSMSTFTDICTKVLGAYGDQITWVAADTKITDIGKASSWNEKIKARWSYGFGGTDFGDVIMDIFRDKVIYHSKKYPKADLLIISTDCAVMWPKSRPRGNCKLLIVNVDTIDTANQYLPQWVDRRREFIQMD